MALVTAAAAGDAIAGEEAAEARAGLAAARANPRLCVSAVASGTAVAPLAARGFDLVIAVGPAFAGEAMGVAASHPRLHLAVLDARLAGGPPNLLGATFRADQAAYLAGVVAGLASQTHVLAGVYGPAADPDVRALRTAWEKGILHAAPADTVRGVFQPPGPAFATVDWSSRIAADQLAGGADVLFGSRGTPGDGVFATLSQRLRSPRRSPLYCVGVEVDQYRIAPALRPCLITSAEKRFAAAVQLLVGAFVKAGRWPGAGVALDVRAGAVGYAPLHDLGARLNASQVAVLEATRLQLADGTLSSGVA